MTVGYADRRLQPTSDASTPTEALSDAGGSSTRDAPPRAWPLVAWLNRAGASRLRFRILQGFAFSLVLNELSLYWLAVSSGVGVAGQTRLLASTVFWTVWLGLAAGWVLLGGWFEEPTRALFGQLAQRRGFAPTVSRSLEVLASWRWLSGLLAFPSLACGIVAATQVANARELAALTSTVALALLFTQLTTGLVLGATVALRPLEPAYAKRLWLFACIVPELLRPIFSGLPTVRTLANVLEAGLLRWGAGG